MDESSSSRGPLGFNILGPFEATRGARSLPLAGQQQRAVLALLVCEAGHPICGDTVYHRRPEGTDLPDASGAPRLALHAAELGFTHPATEEPLHWAMPPPGDLARFVERVRAAGG